MEPESGVGDDFLSPPWSVDSVEQFGRNGGADRASMMTDVSIALPRFRTAGFPHYGLQGQHVRRARSNGFQHLLPG
jgi:hypothetical protein